MNKLLTVALCATISAQAFSAGIFSLAMDQQVNNGAGNVIYPYNDSQFPLEIGTNGAFTRAKMKPGAGWYYGPFVSFRRMLGHDLDLSNPNTVMTFDARVFHGSTNTEPYKDANVFVRVYTGDANHAYLGYRDFNLVYGPNMSADPNKYPNWKTPVLYMNDFAKHKASIGNTDPNYTAYVGGGTFDLTKVTYMRFYGSDWKGMGDDYLDVKNLKIAAVPEPASMIALGLGAIGMLARRRRR